MFPFRNARAFSAFKYRNYRIYWSGLLVAVTGWQIMTFTQLWLIYDLTHSALYLGLAGGINGGVNICLSVFSGVFVDRVDRRKLLLVTQSSMAIQAFALAILTVTHTINVWHILVMTAFTGASSAFDSPGRQALVPQLVDDPKDIPPAVAMASSIWSAARVIGPALAGVFLATIGAALGFFVTAIGYSGMVFTLSRLDLGNRVVPAARSRLLVEFKEGWRYVLSDRTFTILMAMTFLNSVFGQSYEYLLPVFAKDILEVGPTGYGFLMASAGSGAVGGILAVAALSHRGNRGKQLLAGNILFGVFLILFSLSDWYIPSLALIGIASFFNAMYMTNVLTLLQSLVPDRLRGRVMAIYTLTWSLSTLGGMQAGFVTHALNAPMAVIIGAVIILGFALFVTLSYPRIRELE